MSTTGTILNHAIFQDGYGEADLLRFAEVATPKIGANELLLRVHGAGLDRGTWHIMEGRPYLLRLIGFGMRKPKNQVPGIDVAGTVLATGRAVTRFAVGDEVYGIARGSFATVAAAREDKLARKPVNLSFEQAAIVPISAIVALQALTDVGRVQAGQHVLITGASGGVGTYAVQLAKSFGAEVTGTCRTTKLDLLRSLGADHVIDYTRDDFAAGPQRYDLILDIGGNPTLSRLRRALTPTGTAVIIGGEEGGKWTGGFGRHLRAAAMSPFVSQRLVMFAAKERGSDLERLTELIEAGTLTPVLDKTFTLSRVPEAMHYLEAGKARGKVAITI
ncbi:NADPH:quinone reductase-like Zn-dependent oxidoreductase [Asanoa ferruginea]|uniref:NADPH:quinone reductase-like Zn-dependent oxidoreductase n=1 Tax=Asanoa ferruginea TaxID=53367 RepID=A0A3D9ZB31_9ACTN|nr:NAD(P)-dependent alcohol dehydrogenase [Asanoa ferruginea]REF94626.1 NADPH:quinone reductase-like Zn-dependent oxidoreductase [Asanoa ferruginea]GIF50818.1 NADPH:quinone reductase [Asanoa ferruginea]